MTEILYTTAGKIDTIFVIIRGVSNHDNHVACSSSLSFAPTAVVQSPILFKKDGSASLGM